MNVVTKMRDFFTTTPESKQETTEWTTRLFHCGSCDSTFVSEHMEQCSECAVSVESVPTESDLGLI